MSESRLLLVSTAERLFGDPTTTWTDVVEAGFPLLLTPEAEGGFGGDWGDAFAVLRVAGRAAFHPPVAEAIIAGAVAAAAGLPPAEGFDVLGVRADGAVHEKRFTGLLSETPWSETPDGVLFMLEGRVWRVGAAQALMVREADNPAGEKRARLRFVDAEVESGAAVDLLALCAFGRAAQIAGALDGALEMSIAYANDRFQFGRAISKFQAVQQALAVFAEEAAAANAAAQAAAEALDRGDADLEIAAAKFIANRAAEAGVAIAHQVHGALGFTEEYPLHLLTRRLLAWRSEYGADILWAERLGRRVAALGPEAFWAEIARRSDPIA